MTRRRAWSGGWTWGGTLRALVAVLVLLVAACSADHRRGEDLRVDRERARYGAWERAHGAWRRSFTSSGVPLEDLQRGAPDGARCRFRREASFGGSPSQDEKPIGPILRQASDAEGAPTTCEGDLDWGAWDLLLVDLRCRCCHFEPVGARAEGDELVLGVERHGHCCGIEMHGNYRAIYRVAAGYAAAHLELREVPPDHPCGAVP